VKHNWSGNVAMLNSMITNWLMRGLMLFWVHDRVIGMVLWVIVVPLSRPVCSFLVRPQVQVQSWGSVKSWGTNSNYICYVEESRPPLWSSGQSSWLHNGDVLCFMWGTNWIYICYVEESRSHLWSSGQSSWLQNVYVLCSLWGTNSIYVMYKNVDRLWGLVVRVPGYRTYMYCASCEVRTQFIYVM
jgi:hypothetical protein